MKFKTLSVALATAALLTACGSTPEEEKLEAEAEQTQEETRTMKEYKECVHKAKTDAEKLNACEYLLKAVP